MINLLPTDVRDNYTYARQSTKLLVWSSVCIASILGTAVIVFFGMFFMNQSIKTYAAQNAQAQQALKDQKLDETQKHIQSISNDMKLVVKVLSKEILFSKLIGQIATIIPQNATLSDLEITSTQGALELKLLTKNYDTAAQVQANLQDPTNKIFNKADILSITCGGKNPTYPCTVSIRAQFSPSNPFQFINASGSTK